MKNKPYTLDPRKIDAAIKRIRKEPGISIASIARELDVSRQTLAYHCRRAGIHTRPVVVRPKSDA